MDISLLSVLFYHFYIFELPFNHFLYCTIVVWLYCCSYISSNHFLNIFHSALLYFFFYIHYFLTILKKDIGIWYCELFWKIPLFNANTHKKVKYLTRTVIDKNDVTFKHRIIDDLASYFSQNNLLSKHTLHIENYLGSSRWRTIEKSYHGVRQN